MSRSPEIEALHKRIAAGLRADAQVVEARIAEACAEATLAAAAQQVEELRQKFLILRADVVERWGFGGPARSDPDYSAYCQAEQRQDRLLTRLQAAENYLYRCRDDLQTARDARAAVRRAVLPIREDAQAASREEAAMSVAGAATPVPS